jgi:hypothetical protein
MLTESVNINKTFNINTTLNNNTIPNNNTTPNNNYNAMANYMANIVLGGGAGNMPDITADDIMGDIPADVAGDITDEMLQEMFDGIYNSMDIDVPGDSSEAMADNLPEHQFADIAQAFPDELDDDEWYDMVDNWLDDLPDQFPVEIPQDTPVDDSQDLPTLRGYFTVDDMANIVADDIPDDLAGEITADMVETTYQDMMAVNPTVQVTEDEPSDILFDAEDNMSTSSESNWDFICIQTCTFPVDLCDSPSPFFGIALYINRSKGLIDYQAVMDEDVDTGPHTIREDIYDNRGTEYISYRILELYFKLNPSSPEQVERIAALEPGQFGAIMAELVCERSFEGEGCGILAMRKTAAFTNFLALMLEIRAVAIGKLMEVWRDD